ncbi:MAG: PAS domain S-box protein [Armatimonadetes bacterium]|nr:PAS domain S-box protein [Armatimonadota bacterium]
MRAKLRVLEFAATHSLEEAIVVAIDEAEALTGSGIGFFHFVDDGEQSLTLQAWSTQTAGGMCKTPNAGAHLPTSDAGVWGDALTVREPVIHNDYAGLPHRKGLPEWHTPVVRELVAPVLRSGRVVALMGVGNKPTDYAAVDVDAVVCLANLASDVFQTRRDADRIRESEDRLRGTFEQAAVGMAEVSLDRRWLRVNQRLCDILGYSRAELKERTVEDLCHPEDRGADSRLLSRLLADEVQTYSIEQRYVRPDQSIVWANRTTSLVRSPEGKPRYFVFVVEDISARKQAEDEARRLNAELDRRNCELAQVIHVASHDLRSPLMNVQGFSHELQMSVDDLSSALTYEGYRLTGKDRISQIVLNDIPESLRHVQSSVAAMDRLIRGLLTISRLGRAAMQLEPLDVAGIAVEVAEGFESQARKLGAAIHVQDLPPCVGDASMIRQVFVHLMDNALKYLDPARPGVIVVSGEVVDGEAVYTVEDNGIGIAAEHQDRVFELYHRLNPRADEGEGLGLSITRTIIGRHQGRAWITSRVGRGTRLSVSVPIS